MMRKCEENKEENKGVKVIKTKTGSSITLRSAKFKNKNTVICSRTVSRNKSKKQYKLIEVLRMV